jgi:hypothetical protein
VLRQRVREGALTPHARPPLRPSVSPRVQHEIDEANKQPTIDLGTLTPPTGQDDQPHQPKVLGDTPQPGPLPPPNTWLDNTCHTGGQTRPDGTQTGQTWQCGAEDAPNESSNVLYLPFKDPALGVKSRPWWRIWMSSELLRRESCRAVVEGDQESTLVVGCQHRNRRSTTSRLMFGPRRRECQEVEMDGSYSAVEVKFTALIITMTGL